MILKCVINMLQVSEYLVVCFTSSLTFSIAGVAKEIMTLSLAVYIYNEHLSYINLVSCLHHFETLWYLFSCVLCLIMPFPIKYGAGRLCGTVFGSRPKGCEFDSGSR